MARPRRLMRQALARDTYSSPAARRRGRRSRRRRAAAAWRTPWRIRASRVRRCVTRPRSRRWRFSCSPHHARACRPPVPAQYAPPMRPISWATTARGTALAYPLRTVDPSSAATPRMRPARWRRGRPTRGSSSAATPGRDVPSRVSRARGCRSASRSVHCSRSSSAPRSAHGRLRGRWVDSLLTHRGPRDRAARHYVVPAARRPSSRADDDTGLCGARGVLALVGCVRRRGTENYRHRAPVTCAEAARALGADLARDRGAFAAGDARVPGGAGRRYAGLHHGGDDAVVCRTWVCGADAQLGRDARTRGPWSSRMRVALRPQLPLLTVFVVQSVAASRNPFLDADELNVLFSGLTITGNACSISGSVPGRTVS